MPNTQHNSPISEQSVDASPTGDSVSMVNTTARRVSQRTTDLIAIAIVSVGVLTVSGRLAEWWNTDPADTLSPATSAAQMAGSAKGWGSGESAVHLLAGDAQVQMERRIIFGDQFRVDRILRDRLVEILESPPAANQPDHQ
ncbi:MAG: hypothetical protein O3B13_19415, partial [Planctomycetota bacterium]|nr:hypothetical protein [Planctomycetota bacterium]